MERRHLLVALCALGTSFPVYGAPLYNKDHRRQCLHARIARLSNHPASANQIADACFRYIQKQKIVAGAFDEFNNIFGCYSSDLACIDEAKMRTILRNAIMDDFEQGRTVNVDGWLMSKTELFFCALVSCHDI